MRQLTPEQALGEAVKLRQRGQLQEARRMLARLVTDVSEHAPAWNMLGLIDLAEGKPQAAIDCFRKAIAADPKAPALRLNMADAFRKLGDHIGELESLDSALAIEPYFLAALIRKAQVLESLGQMEAAVQIWQPMLRSVPYDQMPAEFRMALDHGRVLVSQHADRRLTEHIEFMAAVGSNEELRRVRLYAENAVGKRKIFHQEPVGAHFPFLPAFEFFDRDRFPWFAELEQTWTAVRNDLMSVWGETDLGFAPYVQFDATVPVNQWAELNHSPRWSAFFLWRDGVRQDANCTRCPTTAALLDRLPLLDIPGKAPNALFSVLQPRTRIPPHTGTSNVRTTVHLPLIVPRDCGFRVGGEVREWLPGHAWAFDDTIEHEAWNDSDEPRAVLILDCWNPLINEVERAAIRRVG